MRISSKKSNEQFEQYKVGECHRILLPNATSKAYDAEMSLADDAEYAAKAAAAEKEETHLKIEADRIRRAAAEKDRIDAALKPEVLPDWCYESSDSLKEGFFSDTYSNEAIRGAMLRANSRSFKDKHEKKRLIDTLELYERMGGRRPLAAPPSDWRDRLDRLQDEMPNFARVTDYLRAEFALAGAAGCAPKLTPMLLDGPPGVGKTTFARALAALFGSGFFAISMETAQTASNLTGSEEYWGNSRTGQLFSLLVNEQFANPVVLIDEVEKANVRGGSGYDPAAALYSLLEPTSASKWHDLSIPDLQLDASRVIWILTSNAKNRLPSPLLSRMRVFDVPGLSAEQSDATARRVFESIVRGLEIGFDTSLPDEVAQVLALVSPREMHRFSRELVAKAVLDDRKTVVPDDLVGLGVAPPYKIEALKKKSAVIHVSLAVGFVEESDSGDKSTDSGGDAELDEMPISAVSRKKPTLH